MKPSLTKPIISLPECGGIKAYAIIVDINHYTKMVRAAQDVGESIAQFTRDTLDGAIQAIERNGGEVVGFMGDAVLGVLEGPKNIVCACYAIAKMVDRVCEYISGEQKGSNCLWAYAPGGPSLKIAIEFGEINISTIGSRFLGQHRLLAGNCINHAARISAAGKGNRCVVGPTAAKMAFKDYDLEGPQLINGKRGEPQYEYYIFSMGDIWIEGSRRKGKETYWG